MPSYLVETFLARAAVRERDARERRVASAVEALTRSGTSVRFDGSIHVPGDEICFFRFEAGSIGDVARAADLAELRPIRIVEAVSSRAVEP